MRLKVTAREYCLSSPLPLTVPQRPERFEPYIYTNRDMEQLLVAADSMRQRFHVGRGTEPHTVRTLLLLLYGTGLRISEALSLLLSDYDADSRVLTTRETKFFKSRFVPVGPDLGMILQRYIDRQWSSRLCTETTPLLANRKGVLPRQIGDGSRAKGGHPRAFQPFQHNGYQAQALERRSILARLPPLPVIGYVAYEGLKAAHSAVMSPQRNIISSST
jgi:integrase